MIYAITCNGKDRDSLLDPRFGRARYFVIYDSEAKNIKDIIDNDAKSSGHGAGIRTSQAIINMGVDAIVTGAVGPNAFGVLSQAGIVIYSNSGLEKVKDAINAIDEGGLSKIESAGQSHKGL